MAEVDKAAGEAKRMKKEFGKLRLSEKVLGAIALVVLLGWFIHWAGGGGGAAAGAGFPWFPVFSIAGALLVLALIVMKVNCIEFTGFSASAQEKTLPCVSLLPLAGFLIRELDSFVSLMTVGGSIALAYISATSYWRNYMPAFVTNPLGEKEKKEKPEEKPPAPGTDPQAGEAAESPPH